MTEKTDRTRKSRKRNDEYGLWDFLIGGRGKEEGIESLLTLNCPGMQLTKAS